MRAIPLIGVSFKPTDQAEPPHRLLMAVRGFCSSYEGHPTHRCIL
nr:MAG TPA: hypothetical protein [Caudoviricetes sp.]